MGNNFVSVLVAAFKIVVLLAKPWGSARASRWISEVLKGNGVKQTGNRKRKNDKAVLQGQLFVKKASF